MTLKFDPPNGLIFHLFFKSWKDINHVDEFYNQRLEAYLYNHSHEKSSKENHLDNDKLYYSGVTKDGIRITETDFLEYEIFSLNGIPQHRLDFDAKKRVQFYREYLQRKILNILFGETKPLPKPEIDLNEDFVNETWFKIGLTFATGRAQDLYEKYKQERGHFTKITLKLGFKETYRPYFSETLNNSRDDYKNIYSSREKLEKIYTYCQVRNILMCADFLAQLKSK